MSPTWLEIAVAILLLWIAWRIGLLLAPWIIAKFRARFSSTSSAAATNAANHKVKPPALTNKE